jgi:carbon-monoxide dehydrogenase medium subunit
VIPAAFDYARAGSVDEAIELIGREDAKLLAGGHSLIPLLKLRFARPAHLIDVRKIPGLAGIREEANAVVIGSGTTHRQLATSSVLWNRLPIVAEAAAIIGEACSVKRVMTTALVVGSAATSDEALSKSLAQLRPYAMMVVVANADDYIEDMLTALRA